MRTPSYFGLTCRHLFGIELLPFQIVMLRELWRRKFPMLIATRGGSKTWILSLYALLRAIFMPGSKIVVVGAAFRQSKLMFEYLEEFWRRAPILRNMVGSGKHQGPKRDVDRCNFHVGESEIIAIPLGDGTKIRGLRAHFVLADEFASIPQETFEVVVKGFGSVAHSPAERVQTFATIETLREIGFTKEAKLREGELGFGNQTVISGTAYYAFNHFYDYWKRYKAIVESHGEEKKLIEIFQGKIPEDFDWKDYSIFRVPYTSLPRGFMDETQIAQSKATFHLANYQMEYGACGYFDTPIITTNGVKNLGDVQVGDLVLTHKGRFRRVLKRTYQHYDGDIVNLKSYGCYHTLGFTPEHPFLMECDNFIAIDDIHHSVKLARLRDLSKLTEIHPIKICTNYVDRDDFIYPKSSQSFVSNKDRKLILSKLENGVSQTKLSRRFGLSQSAISCIKNDRRKPKNSIPQTILLSYDFGVVVGYYVAEGSIGANGRQCSFDLDGHHDESLEFFVGQLVNSLNSSIGVSVKLYKRKDNVVSATVNSRVFSEVMKYICPGDCYTKLVNHDILFSNEEFMKGFIIGVWNGDGYKNDKHGSIQLSNLNLITQIKLALSYFGINASILKPKRKSTGIIKGKKVNLSTAWKLNLDGSNLRQFLNIFYSQQTSITTTNRQRIYSNDSCCVNMIRNKYYKKYSGYVYNLEVEEDHSYSTLNATTHNCFATDSNGFFKRSLIESCVCNKPLSLPSCDAYFSAVTHGHPNRRYIYGIDPASEHDNFSIVILEVWEDHRRVVYCWSANRQSLREQMKSQGKANTKSFYNHCARKIRDLMNIFPTDHIAMDAQGGGIHVMEALHDADQKESNEPFIWPWINQGEKDIFWWEEKDKPTDGEAGLHLLHLCQFAKQDFTYEANHGLRKDMEDKMLLFPRFDSAEIEISIQKDKLLGLEYDTLEDSVMEIEELKDEMSTIVHDQTPSGRDRWDTPEVKLPGNKKGRLRKDRYSALLLANIVARLMEHRLQGPSYEFVGGYVGQKNRGSAGKLYSGPDHLVSKMQGSYYGKGVIRG